MGNAFEQELGQTSQPQPVAPKPLPEIPQPIQDVRTNGMHGISAEDTPASFAEIQAAMRTPAQTFDSTHNAFEKDVAQTQQKVTSPVTGAEHQQGQLPADESSDTMKYLHKLWNSTGEFIGEHVPQAATGPLAFATHYVIEPYEESMAWASKTAGELAEKAAVFGTPYTVEQAREKFPRTMGIESAVAETAGGLVADPRNWPLMAGSLAKPILKRLMSAGFATQMGAGVKDQAEQLAENWDSLTPYERWKQGTSFGLGSAMTVGAASHAAFGEAKVAPKTGGTEAGKRTTIRPTTVKTAGVEAPIPASAQAHPGAVTSAAAHLLATPGEANAFQQELTKPAATKQMVSSLSQSATDKIAAHDALSNGEAAPPPISGTQTPGAHATPDRIWEAMQQSASKTWDKARDASTQEQDAWERDRKTAVKNHQDAIAHYNELVDNHNADPANVTNQMQRIEFDPTEADVREKPATYDELKATLDSAKDRAGFNNPSDVRQKARDVEIPKAEKAMDSWFKDHEDQVSPNEYNSAKQLWADSERFKEIATNIRGKLAKGNVTANDIRGLEAVIDGKAIKYRGAAGIGEFRRLVGPETYENLQNVSKLFEPFEKTSPLAQFKSWGMWALKGILVGALGFEHGGIGVAGLAGLGAETVFAKLMNHIMFNPEFGSAFRTFVDATKNAVQSGTRVSKDIVDGFKSKITDLWKSESGEMSIPGTGGRPSGPKPKFDLTDNGVDEQGDKNHILAISHEGEHVGHLNISQRTPDSWTINDASIRPDMQGKGLGTAAYEHAFEQAAARGMKTVESDISTTKPAARTWRRLMEKYPDAITEENDQFTADVTKMHPRDFSDAASTAHNANGGSTFHPVMGDLNGKPFFAVGGEPEFKNQPALRMDTEGKDVTPEQRREFANRPEVKAALAAHFDASIGSWFDSETGKSVTELVKTPGDRQAAIDMGIKNDQKAIYDLEKGVEIPTGGKDTAPVEEPKISGDDVVKHVAKMAKTTEEYARQLVGLDAGGDYQLKDVPIDSIKTTDETVSRFVKQYADMKSEIPAIVLDMDGKIRDGNHRLAAAKLRGDKTIKAYVPVDSFEDTGFDTGALDKELNADEQAYRAGLSSHEISTRQPSQDKIDPVTKKKTTITPPNDPSRLSGLASLNEANNTPRGRGSATQLSMKQKLVAAFAEYEGTGLKLTQEDINNPGLAVEKIVNHIQDNYQWVYDSMPDSIRQVAQQWYETVHNSTKAEAEKTGLSHPQVAGVVAALSPQNSWDNNRESAYKLIDLIQNQSNHEWSPDMDTTLQTIKDTNTTVRPGAPGLTNGQIAFGKTADAVRGKTFHDFDAEPDKEVRQGLQALWLRVLDEAHTEDRSIPTMNPNGEIMGHAGARAWPGLDVMARGLDIILNGKNADGTANLELINEHLGGGNKVRNFYNNMINPWSERGHFTADTHQVGAGLLQAVSSKSTEALHNFGSGNKKGIASPGKNGPTGVKGTYPVYQEAGVRAAGKNGLRPNQFQSISWEGIRSLLGDDKKTDVLEKAIREIWAQYENGDLTKPQVREAILKASGGFTKPEWMSQAAWDADPSPNKAETVLANRLPEETPEAIVDAAKTRKVREQMEDKAKKKAEQADKQAEQKAKAAKKK